MNEDILKQLTRIADALEAQNAWHTDVWFPYTKACREEDAEQQAEAMLENQD